MDQQPQQQQLPQQPQAPQTPPTPNNPLFNQPFTNPLGPPAVPVVSADVSSANQTPEHHAPSKLFMVLGIVAAMELLLILGLAVALSNAPKASNRSKSSASTAQSQEPQPATAIGLQQTNDSITADITNLVNDKDYPTGQLDDKVLGL